MFAKTLLVLASAALIVSAAAPSHAFRSSQGTSVQGVSVQSLPVQGASLFTVEGIELPATFR